MEKKFFLLFLFFLLSFLFCENVYATVSDETTVSDELSSDKDDIGRFITGYGSLKLNNDDGYRLTTYNFSVDDGLGYIYVVERISGNQYVYYLNGSGSCTYDVEWFNHFSKDDKDFSNTATYTKTLYDFNALNYGIYLFQCGFDDDYLVNFNIPVFSSEDIEGINKYINNGDYSSANNADDVDKSNPDFEENIEKPRELKVQGGYASGLSNAYSFNHNFIAKWMQTVDTSDYLYDVQAQCTIGSVKSGGANYTGNYATSDWIDFGTKNYGGATDMTYTITSDNLNNKLLGSAMEKYTSKYGKLQYKGYLISKLRVRIRNRSSNKASDWVVVTVDYDSTSTTANVEDDEGNTKDDDEYNGGDVTDSNDSSESVESGIANILSFIRTGFGLLGDGGVISLMSKCFIHLPASIWSMLKFLVAMMVLMSVISLIKKFVF